MAWPQPCHRVSPHALPSHQYINTSPTTAQLSTAQHSYRAAMPKEILDSEDDGDGMLDDRLPQDYGGDDHGGDGQDAGGLLAPPASARGSQNLILAAGSQQQQPSGVFVSVPGKAPTELIQTIISRSDSTSYRFCSRKLQHCCCYFRCSHDDEPGPRPRPWCSYARQRYL